VGKTAVAVMIVRALLDADATPILAVDADPNLNLDAALGVAAPDTIGQIRELAAEDRDTIPTGMSTREYFDYQMRMALLEAPGFDLLAMGRPEGPGCYCAANHVLRLAIDRLVDAYAYAVMDCEAGLEHLSRRTTRDLDLLVVVTDPTVRGAQTVTRVLQLIAELKTQVKDIQPIVNRVRDRTPQPVLEVLAEAGLGPPLELAEDEEIIRRDAVGEPLLDLPPDNPALAAVRELVAQRVLSRTASAGSGR
jgi:CO dehydrogenase maturation factor